jgi:hypothetical protein
VDTPCGSRKRQTIAVTITRRTLRSFGLATTVLGIAFVSSMVAFVYVLYGGAITTESVIEGSHYAMQTVTSVGYGNWESPA